jgi:tetratricopeptide (TPR) repeat protein
VTFTVDVTAFGKDPRRHVEVACFSPIWSEDRFMRVARVQPDPKLVRYELDYRISGKERFQVNSINFYIARSVLDYEDDSSSSHSFFHIFHESEPSDVWNERMDAFALYQEKKYVEAKEKYKALSVRSVERNFDLEMLAASANAAGDYPTVAQAWLDHKTSGRKNLPPIARALFLSGNYREVVNQLKPVVRLQDVEDWQGNTDLESMGYLGLSYIRTDQIDRAKELSRSLREWMGSGNDTYVIQFRNDLRIHEVLEEARKAPESSVAIGNLGRALADLGRYEEAIMKLQESLRLDPTQIPIRRDLAWAILQLRGDQINIVDLRKAVDDAKKSVNYGQAKAEVKDFYSWIKCAILQYVLSEDGIESVERASLRDEAIESLRKALSLGRKAAELRLDTWDRKFEFTGLRREFGISGFEYPQACAGLLLLQSLKRLRRDPEYPFALLGQSQALLRLG